MAKQFTYIQRQCAESQYAVLFRREGSRLGGREDETFQIEVKGADA